MAATPLVTTENGSRTERINAFPTLDLLPHDVLCRIIIYVDATCFQSVVATKWPRKTV
jgi:hypothetical protein